jgi:hypothetical protein
LKSKGAGNIGLQVLQFEGVGDILKDVFVVAGRTIFVDFAGLPRFF